ncbi:class I SAM-dependent methyltransferase [Streptomyces chlorus]|uniref:Methyltransferase type 12 n=1 Tax=Streptomyces chlorus TaxID=887452 RepID=A0ABW1DS17_9ACTN
MAGSDSGGTEDAGDGKSRFDDIYDRPDPRAYFRRLAPLEYEIPHHAQPVFRQVAAERAALDDGRPHRPAVLDVCCSYGINAALLNHDVTLAEMYERYTSPACRTMSTADLAARDKEFYAERRRPDAVPVFGLDVSAPAVHYALEVGLLDAAFTDDLEQGSPGPGLNRALAEAGLITLTGGGSYVTARTFTALLDGARRPVWVSAFVLRTVSYQPIVRTLAAHGLSTTVDASRTYPQRLFTDERERQYAIAAVRALGGDPAGREEAGRFHTLHYESRPDTP